MPTPKLFMRERTVLTVRYIALEKFIAEVYGQEIDIRAMEEANNDAPLNFFATNTTLRIHDEKVFTNWRINGGFLNHGTALILNMLVLHNYIPSGYYMILMEN